MTAPQPPDTPDATRDPDQTDPNPPATPPDPAGDQHGGPAAPDHPSADNQAGERRDREAGTEQQATHQPTPPRPTPGSARPASDAGQEPDVSALPGWAQKLIHDVRAEAAGSRTKARDAESRHQQMLEAIATALGLKGEDEAEKDPAKLTERLGASQTEARMLKVERALDRAARRHGADEELLVAWLAHTGKLAGLDPTTEEFASQVDTLVADAVAGNPKLKAAAPPPPSRSGGEFTGAPGEPAPARPAAMSIDDHREVRRKRRAVP